MNCAESQDLLLDLAYGELPPARAAEVQEHVLGCASCRAEKEQLDDARKAAAPLRDLEEPPAGFDEPILRAARAEAGMQADGTPGPVVEISATVKPLGLQAARLDPHARMRDGGGRPRPRWWRRAAVVGSIAAAAGLAVVVTSSVTSRAPPPAAREEVAPIQVRAPGAPVPSSVDRAISPGGERAAPPERKNALTGQPTEPEPAPAPTAKKDADAHRAKAKLARRDAEGTAAQEDDRAIAGAVEQLQKEAAPPAKAPANDALARRSRAAAAPPANAESETAGGTVASQSPRQQISELSSKRDVAPAPPAAAPRSPVPAAGVLAAGPANPDQLEDQASAARRRGEYVRAASLYRQASAQRRQADPGRAAWDMAHAVECLAAGGQVDDAISARKELLRTFPDHAGPRAAADSALRSVRLPPDEEKAPAPAR